MSISFLQQQALSSSNDFNVQVNGVVAQQALYKFETTPDLTAYSRQTLSQVVRQPGSFGFVTTILVDAGWGVSYDTWAADPAGQEGAILAGVQKAWPLLVGELETIPPPVEETPEEPVTA